MSTSFLPETTYARNVIATASDYRFTGVTDWPQDLPDSEARFWDPDTVSWFTSLGVHVLLLLIFGLLAGPGRLADEVATLVVPLVEETESEPEIVKLEMNDALDEQQLENIGAASLGTVEVAAPSLTGDAFEMPQFEDLATTQADVSGIEVTLHELTSNDNAGLVEDLVGVRGAIVNAQGDTGSVDRISTEIMTRLESGDVLVAWLMDASESLRPRREKIIERFTRIYEELDELAEESASDDALLTSVSAFGADLTAMTKQPTADREGILAAVRDIKADDSGVENVFSAVLATAKEDAKYVRAGRQVMVIVVTDECGNDLDQLEAALAMLQRHRMAVYVIGPVAPFARDKVAVKWNDPETGDTLLLPVDAGPETAYIEQASLNLWEDGPGSQPISSGFGPFGLTRLTHENGGMYLLHDDHRISGPAFDVERLMRYRPDYVSDAKYHDLATEHPVRMAVLRTSQTLDKYLADSLPRTFLAAGIQFEIKPIKRKVLDAVDILQGGLNELKSVESQRNKEISARWLAHYDLLKGRLLANLVRCYSFAKLLDAMYDDPQPVEDGTKNAWQAVGREDAEAAETELPPTELEESRLAHKYLQRVIDENPDTPWAELARSELKFAMCLHWHEAFLEPPDGVALPWDKKPWDELTEAQKKAKTAFDKKKEARKIRKAAKGETKKRPPPKL